MPMHIPKRKMHGWHCIDAESVSESSITMIIKRVSAHKNMMHKKSPHAKYSVFDDCSWYAHKRCWTKTKTKTKRHQQFQQFLIWYFVRLIFIWFDVVLFGVQCISDLKKRYGMHCSIAVCTCHRNAIFALEISKQSKTKCIITFSQYSRFEYARVAYSCTMHTELCKEVFCPKE